MQAMELNMEALTPLLETGAKVRLQVTGTSMQPLLRNGKDSVLLCSPNNPKKGDILLYQRQGSRFVLHRVVALGETTLLCCGDNQWRKEPILPQQVIATVCAYCREEKEYPVKGFVYWCYVNHLPLRRLFCRLRDWLFAK